MDDDDSSEGVILVMGVTGAGKSYFLNQLKEQSVKEGHTLFAGRRPRGLKTGLQTHPDGGGLC